MIQDRQLSITNLTTRRHLCETKLLTKASVKRRKILTRLKLAKGHNGSPLWEFKEWSKGVCSFWVRGPEAVYQMAPNTSTVHCKSRWLSHKKMGLFIWCWVNLSHTGVPRSVSIYYNIFGGHVALCWIGNTVAMLLVFRKHDNPWHTCKRAQTDDLNPMENLRSDIKHGYTNHKWRLNEYIFVLCFTGNIFKQFFSLL